jgi:hypothetical protein
MKRIEKIGIDGKKIIILKPETPEDLLELERLEREGSLNSKDEMHGEGSSPEEKV